MKKKMMKIKRRERSEGVILQEHLQHQRSPQLVLQDIIQIASQSRTQFLIVLLDPSMVSPGAQYAKGFIGGHVIMRGSYATCVVRQVTLRGNAPSQWRGLGKNIFVP